MKCLVMATMMLAAGLSWATPAIAGGIFVDVPMTRVFACRGPDAVMEVYVPQSVLTKRNVEKQGLGGTVNGLYALALTGAQQSKTIEPVRLRSTKDNTAIVLTQFTRKGLKPATIPMIGGSIDFDQHSGSQAKCEQFQPS